MLTKVQWATLLNPFPQIIFNFGEKSVATSHKIKYDVYNTPTSPLGRKANAHFWWVFSFLVSLKSLGAK